MTLQQKIALVKTLIGKKVTLDLYGGLVSVYGSDAPEYEVSIHTSNVDVKIIRFREHFDNDGVYDDEPGAIDVDFLPSVEASYYDAEEDEDKSEKIHSGTIMLKDITSFSGAFSP